MAEQAVLYEAAGGIAKIGINRPEKRNALGEEVCAGLADAWRRFAKSDERVAILYGVGGKAFCAGADMRDPPKEMWKSMPGIVADLDKPVIAAIEGYCIGAGYALPMLCDIVVAGETATFSYPEPQVGASGGVIAGLAARIPHKIAMEFMLLGKTISAQRAYEVGMINKVTPAGGAMAGAMEYAEAFLTTAPLVVSMLKRMVYETVTPRSGPEFMARMRREVLVVAESEDRLEGRAAFREKRKPVFKGK
ncbi:MAG: enoyl-CoA hydratase/isomerase family protein [Alphaproteobacteria bacterium]